MFTPIIRIILLIASIGLAIFFYIEEDFINMACSLIGALLFINGYYRNSTVYIAWQQLKKGNFIKAEKLISKIKHPNYLNKGQKSYYHFTKGLIAAKKQEWENGRMGEWENGRMGE